MAITRAQQYRQMLEDGGMLVSPSTTGRRPGYRNPTKEKQKAEKAAADKRREDARTNYQRSQTFDVSKPKQSTFFSEVEDETTPEDRRFTRRQLTDSTTTKDGKEDKPKKKSAILDALFNRRKQLYDFSRKLPGAAKSSFNNLKDYRNYLRSQGVDLSTIDKLMKDVDEENPISYEDFQELAYGPDPKGITDIDKLRDIFNDPTRGPFEKLTAKPQNFSEFMLTQRNNPNLFAAGDLGNFMNMTRPKDLVNPKTGELYTNVEFENLKRKIGQDRGLTGGDGPDPILPIIPKATDDTEDDTEDDLTNIFAKAGISPRIAGSIFAADGGRIGLAKGSRMQSGEVKESRTKSSTTTNPNKRVGAVDEKTTDPRITPGGDKPTRPIINDEGIGSLTTQKNVPTFGKKAFDIFKKINFFTPAGASEMSAEEKAQLLKDAGIEAGASITPTETFPRFMADEYGIYKDVFGGPSATETIVDEYKENYPGLLNVPTEELQERFEKGLADPKLMQVSLPGQNRSMAAEGGMMSPEGGIMDLESGRQMYFLGKLVKKATRAVKKIAKSPVGKVALLYGLGAMGGSFGAGKGLFSKGMFSPSAIKGGLFGLGTVPGVPDAISGGGTMGLFGKLGLTKGGGAIMPTLKGGITLASILPLLVGKTDEEKNDILKDYYASQKLVPSQSVRGVGSEMDFYDYNIPLAEGGMPSKEPVAKETMPLLDMDGKEMDLRAEGGFVPIGRMEKADDVPARLSKNEFVFTADAVRNAGDGDEDKGAEVMYNMMKNLESGGDVSEESQGLEGAREMFQTSKRLEEVL